MWAVLPHYISLWTDNLVAEPCVPPSLSLFDIAAFFDIAVTLSCGLHPHPVNFIRIE